MSGLHDGAVAIAAEITGLRRDEVMAAIQAYRETVRTIEDEPEWSALMHMSGSGIGLAQFSAAGTAVTLEIHSPMGGYDAPRRLYVFQGQAYEFYAEARSVELRQQAKFRPRAVKP